MKSVVLSAAFVRRLIPKRPAASHKGKNGHVLLVAGSRGMTGAALLSALGTLKTGAGLLTVASTPDVEKVIRTRLPEAMTVSPSLKAILAYVRRRTITTLAIGPGLSVSPKVSRVVKGLLDLRIPAVLDADGLNNVKPADIKGRPLIITPHAGELARLLGVSRKSIEKNRTLVAKTTAAWLGLICVLKGHHTVISDGHEVRVNATGNPAMATGGMGDVLTGVIAAFHAEGLSLFDAASAGVYVHGLAGDIARRSDRGLLASELAGSVPLALRKLGLK